jgi:hypothetical protein
MWAMPPVLAASLATCDRFGGVGVAGPLRDDMHRNSAAEQVGDMVCRVRP